MEVLLLVRPGRQGSGGMLIQPGGRNPGSEYGSNLLRFRWFRQEVQFLESCVAGLRWASLGHSGSLPVSGVGPPRPEGGPRPAAASGAKGHAAGWGRGRRGDKGRGYRAAEGGCGGEVPPRCRDPASPGTGRAPAPQRTSA
ncbi:unnamed protein product [Rangifer tarandus platyrhynchus]|uniref:Uncharacterized protein n=2 Tax=Rangifer tarandus platyrhynchus TaxID=3082113 RepID=A0ABN8XWI4_RANTA|nr:unnamed protein product [Rangifer tarandus platyrhynchus]CAI9691849.1 unnamed protein product [Rangifer tarandus platyrhynchus]